MESWPFVDGVARIGAGVGVKVVSSRLLKATATSSTGSAMSRLAPPDGDGGIPVHLAVEGELGALSRRVADVAALTLEGGDVHHELRAQAAIGEAQVALLGAHLIDEDAGAGALSGRPVAAAATAARW